jgi:hypothetical protein
LAVHIAFTDVSFLGVTRSDEVAITTQLEDDIPFFGAETPVQVGVAHRIQTRLGANPRIAVSPDGV